MTPDKLWAKACSPGYKYGDSGYCVFYRSSQLWEMNTDYGDYRITPPLEELRARLEAGDPKTVTFHGLITHARLIGIEVRGWP